MIRISLVVPTYNRASVLADALRSFQDQSLNAERYEILVVDNNSTDNTREIVERNLASANCQWRYIFEPRQGLHFARNRGLVDAIGDIVVFGDDDIVASKEWLESILKEFDANGEVGVVGGKVLPLWDGKPDPWIYDYGTEKVHPVFAYLDYGDRRLELATEHVFGCNFAVRRALAIQVGGSYPDTFPPRLKHLSGIGEWALADNIRELGFKVVYAPAAMVSHRADSQRAKLKYFADRYERWAIEDVFSEFRARGKLAAASNVVKRAVRRLGAAVFRCGKKRKPGYFLMIESLASLRMLRQTCRILVSPGLYQHINRESYL